MSSIFLALAEKQSEISGWTSNGVSSIFKLIGLIILCILIIFASFLTTRFIGKRQLGQSAKSNFRNIDIYRLSGNKYLQLIEVGKRYYLIAVCKDTVSFISELNSEDIVNWPQTVKNVKFKDVFDNLVKNKSNKESSFPKFDNTASDVGEHTDLENAADSEKSDN